MTEIEFLILTNQSMMINALAVLLRDTPLGAELLQQAQHTIIYLDRNIENIVDTTK